jgi:hypothetical protein
MDIPHLWLWTSRDGGKISSQIAYGRFDGVFA